MQNENTELQNENIELQEEIKKLKATIIDQELRINWFNRYVFGSKSEKTPKKEEIIEGTQISIFGVPEDIKEEVEEKTEEITIYKKKKRGKKERRGKDNVAEWLKRLPAKEFPFGA